MDHPSEGRSLRWRPWLWPATFVVLFTLVLMAALLPWTKMEAALTGPATRAAGSGASAPAAKLVGDEGYQPAPPLGTVQGAATAPTAEATEEEAPILTPPLMSVEEGSGALPANAREASDVLPRAPNGLEEGASSPPNVADWGASRPEPAANIDQIGLLAALVRHGSRPEGLTPADYPGMDVLLATPVYFKFTGRRPPALDDPSIVFFVFEGVHIGELPSLPPRPFLKIGRVYHEPVEVRMLTDSPHHRTTIVLYDAVWSDGDPILTPEVQSLELVFPAGSKANAASVLSWDLPVSYGPGHFSRELSIPGAEPAR